MAKPAELQRFVRIEDVAPNTIESVAIGLQNPIRSYSDHDELETILAVQIQALASAYGARQKIDDHILDKCIELVVQRFSMLGINELDKAFQLAAAGDLSVRSEIWGGVFNVKILGSVLGAYRDHRRKVVAGIIKAESISLDADRTKGKAAKMLEFDQQFPEKIEKAKLEFKSWKDVPVFWYQAAKRLGLLNQNWLKENAQSIYKEAKELAIEEMSVNLANANNQNDQSRFRNLLLELKAGNDVDAAKVIARKLCVFKNLIES